MAPQQYTAEQADVLAAALEAVVDEMRVVAKSESSVRLSAVEYKFIHVAKQCRDICALAVRGDKRYLQEIFSPNDCARVGRMHHACQLVQNCYLFVTAELKEELLASIASVEQVLRDSGSFKSWQPPADFPALDQAFIAEEGELDSSVVDWAASDRTAPPSPSSALMPQTVVNEDLHKDEVPVGRVDSSSSTVELVDCGHCGSARSCASTVGVVDCADSKALQTSDRSGCPAAEAPSEESMSTACEPSSPSLEVNTNATGDPDYHHQQCRKDVAQDEACKVLAECEGQAAGEEISPPQASEEKRPPVGPQRRGPKLMEIAPFTPRVWQRVGSPQWSSSGKEMPVKRMARRGGA